MESLGGSRKKVGSFQSGGGNKGQGGDGGSQEAGGEPGSGRRNSRPSSAPYGSNRSTPVSGGGLQGSRKGVMSISKANYEMAKLRVEEKRQVTEAGLWGGPIEEQGRVNRVKPVQADLPAFWSVARYGQPYSDERRAMGATEWQLSPEHRKSSVKAEPGIIEEQRRSLRRSLETGQLLLDRDTLTPLDTAKSETRRLEADEREYLLSKMKPHELLYALRSSRDRDWAADDFQPWTRDVDPDLDREPWYRNRENTIRNALTTLELIMRTHLKYLSMKDYEIFRAPAMPPKFILKRAFRKVDPQGTGLVSIQQFAQLWQNVLNLMDHREEERVVNKKTRKVLVPIGRRFLDRCCVAAIFCKYGFNKAGLLPYEVFVHAITTKDSRLLGHELILDARANGKNGLNNTKEVSMALSGAKILYTLCKMGVYAPPDFEEDSAFRSAKPPRATMWLEHVYGYAGLKNLSNNLFYTHRGEIAYFCGMIGIVWNKAHHLEGKPSQRFFFGHNNDITCMAIHPSRRFAATGQQTHDDGTPYVCIWDVDTMCQVQRLVHPDDTRSVVAMAFSSWGGRSGDKGGEILATVTSDNAHTVRLWRWLTKTQNNKLLDVTDPIEQVSKAIFIPGSSFGPMKKIADMQKDAEDGQLYFHSSECTPEGGKGAERPSPPPPFDNEDPTGKKSYLDMIFTGKQPMDKKHMKKSMTKKRAAFGGDPAVEEFAQWALNNKWPDTEKPADSRDSWPEGWGSKAGFPGDPKRHFLVRELLERPGWQLNSAKGFEYIDPSETKESDKLKEDDLVAGTVAKDSSWHLLATMHGSQVYGVAFNPFRSSCGKPGCEFLQYGIKHMKTYMKDDPQEDGTEGAWVSSSCSFGTDKVDNVFSACFVPAMHPGKSTTDVCIVAGFPSGKIGLFIPTYPTRPGAVYTLSKLFEQGHDPGKIMKAPDDPRALAGSETYCGVRVLLMRETKNGEFELLSGGADGKILIWPIRPPAANKRGISLGSPAAMPLDPTLEDTTKADRIVGMDAYPDQKRFPDLEPKDEFVAGTDGNDIWEVDDSPMLMVEGNVGDVYKVAAHPRDPQIFASACDSDEVMVWDAHQRRNLMKGSLGFRCRSVAYSQETITGDSGEGFHLAVGGKAGRIAILDAEDLRPVVILHDSKLIIEVVRYSPAGGPGLLAAGGHDLQIYIYNTRRDYQYVCKCVGHSGTVEQLDWSLPIREPKKLAGKYILQSTCTNAEILYWNPQTGKQITANQRNSAWDTWSCKYGFDVMGVWEDGADRTDINSLDRSRRGAARWDATQNCVLQKTDPESAEWTQGGGYLVTAEDTSMIKLFNYPVVQDDAPYRCFRGHASHVMCIRFLGDDRRVISAGAGDQAILQWRTLGVNQYDTEYDWAVMECIDWAISILAESKTSKIPKPGGKNWGETGTGDGAGSKSYGIQASQSAKGPFGGTEVFPYASRQEFLESFVDSMYTTHGQAVPSVLCSLCSGETDAKTAQIKHSDAMFVCCCPHGVHRSLNTCSKCD